MATFLSLPLRLKKFLFDLKPKPIVTPKCLCLDTLTLPTTVVKFTSLYLVTKLVDV